MGINLENVSFSYKKQCKILSDITFNIPQGDFVGIVGKNGSGKSTLAYLFNGLIPRVIKGNLTGEVKIDGIATTEKSFTDHILQVGMVFQNPDFSLFNLTVKEEIEFGLKNFKVTNQDEKIAQALKIVGMQDFLDREPQTLSLGEKQKICIACALALDTKYLVLDEPVAMLDYKSSLDVYGILTELNKKGKTIIVIEHDTDYLWQFARDVMILDQGRLIAYGSKQQIFTQTELFTKLGIKLPHIDK